MTGEVEKVRSATADVPLRFSVTSPAVASGRLALESHWPDKKLHDRTKPTAGSVMITLVVLLVIGWLVIPLIGIIDAALIEDSR